MKTRSVKSLDYLVCPINYPLVCPEHYARILWRDIGHKGLMPYIERTVIAVSRGVRMRRVGGAWREERLLKDESGIAMRSVHGHCPSTKTCLASISVHQPLKSRSASRARNEKLSLLLLDLEPQLHRLPAHATPRGHWSVMRPCQ